MLDGWAVTVGRRSGFVLGGNLRARRAGVMISRSLSENPRRGIAALTGCLPLHPRAREDEPGTSRPGRPAPLFPSRVLSVLA